MDITNLASKLQRKTSAASVLNGRGANSPNLSKGTGGVVQAGEGKLRRTPKPWNPLSVVFTPLTGHNSSRRRRSFHGVTSSKRELLVTNRNSDHTGGTTSKNQTMDESSRSVSITTMDATEQGSSALSLNHFTSNNKASPRGPGEDDRISSTSESNSMSERFRTCLKIRTQEESLEASVARRTSRAPAKKVSFSDIEFRSHPFILGDNPSVSSGPPVSIDWEVLSCIRLTIDQYEDNIIARRKKCHLLMPPSVREDLLRDAGYARSDFRRVNEEVQQIKKSRKAAAAPCVWNKFIRFARARSLYSDKINDIDGGNQGRLKKRSRPNHRPVITPFEAPSRQ